MVPVVSMSGAYGPLHMSSAFGGPVSTLGGLVAANSSPRFQPSRPQVSLAPRSGDDERPGGHLSEQTSETKSVDVSVDSGVVANIGEQESRHSPPTSVEAMGSEAGGAPQRAAGGRAADVSEGVEGGRDGGDALPEPDLSGNGTVGYSSLEGGDQVASDVKSSGQGHADVTSGVSVADQHADEKTGGDKDARSTPASPVMPEGGTGAGSPPEASRPKSKAEAQPEEEGGAHKDSLENDCQKSTDEQQSAVKLGDVADVGARSSGDDSRASLSDVVEALDEGQELPREVRDAEGGDEGKGAHGDSATDAGATSNTCMMTDSSGNTTSGFEESQPASRVGGDGGSAHGNEEGEGAETREEDVDAPAAKRSKRALSPAVDETQTTPM